MVSVIKLDNNNGNPWSQYFKWRSADDHDDHLKWGLKKFFTKALQWNHYDIKYAGNIDKGATHLDSCIWLYCLKPSRKLQWLWNPTNACNACPCTKRSEKTVKEFYTTKHTQRDRRNHLSGRISQTMPGGAIFQKLALIQWCHDLKFANKEKEVDERLYHS